MHKRIRSGTKVPSTWNDIRSMPFASGKGGGKTKRKSKGPVHEKALPGRGNACGIANPGRVRICGTYRGIRCLQPVPDRKKSVPLHLRETDLRFGDHRQKNRADQKSGDP